MIAEVFPNHQCWTGQDCVSSGDGYLKLIMPEVFPNHPCWTGQDFVSSGDGYLKLIIPGIYSKYHDELGWSRQYLVVAGGRDNGGWCYLQYSPIINVELVKILWVLVMATWSWSIPQLSVLKFWQWLLEIKQCMKMY